MSNEEAIEFLKNMIAREAVGFVAPQGDGDVAIWQYHIEALQMAINALEQPEACQDAISRQAAIDELKTRRDSAKEWYDKASADGDEMIIARADSAMMSFIESILTVKKLPSVQPEIIRCKDCKYFEYDHLYIVQDIPVIGHLVCNKWGDGCRTNENGFCFLGERRTDEPDK